MHLVKLEELLPHYGYREDEIPRYAECEKCGETVRADRLDLLHEHRDVCRVKLSVAKLDD